MSEFGIFSIDSHPFSCSVHSAPFRHRPNFDRFRGTSVYGFGWAKTAHQSFLH